MFHIRFLCLKDTLSLFLSHTYTLSLSRSLSHTLSLSLSLSLTHTLSLALSHTHTLSLASERRASTSTSSCRVPHLNQEIGFSIFFSIQRSSRRRVSRSNVKLAKGEEKKFFFFFFQNFDSISKKWQLNRHLDVEDEATANTE